MPAETKITDEQKKVGCWVWPVLVIGSLLFIASLCEILLVFVVGITPRTTEQTIGQYLVGLSCVVLLPFIIGSGMLGISVYTLRKSKQSSSLQSASGTVGSPSSTSNYEPAKPAVATPTVISETKAPRQEKMIENDVYYSHDMNINPYALAAKAIGEAAVESKGATINEVAKTAGKLATTVFNGGGLTKDVATLLVMAASDWVEHFAKIKGLTPSECEAAMEMAKMATSYGATVGEAYRQTGKPGVMEDTQNLITTEWQKR